MTPKEKSIVLQHYFNGTDPTVTYRVLTHTLHQTYSYNQFLELYVSEVIHLHALPAEHKRAALSELEQDNLGQLVKVRDKLLEALVTCVESPLIELAGSDKDGNSTSKTNDRMSLVAGLASAHAKTITAIQALRRQKLEEAAALHSLLASRSESDELDSPGDDPS